MKICHNEVEPYNELVFKSCYYNSLFAAIKYYGGDERNIIENYVPKYRITNNNYMALEYFPIKESNDILLQNSICIKTTKKVSNFAHFITESIQGGKLVIVDVDIFYLPNHKDSYMRSHKTHKLLVIGFDDDKHIFYIIDQKHIDTLSYIKCEVSFEDLERAYIKKESVTTVEKVLNNHTFMNVDILRTSYLRKNIVIDRIRQYEKIISISERATANEYDMTKLDNVIKETNRIIHNKKNESFICQRYDNADELRNLCDKTVGRWSIIRSKLLFGSFEERMSNEDVRLIQNHLEEIKKTEEEFVKLLME